MLHIKQHVCLSTYSALLDLFCTASDKRQRDNLAAITNS